MSYGRVEENGKDRIIFLEKEQEGSFEDGLLMLTRSATDENNRSGNNGEIVSQQSIKSTSPSAYKGGAIDPVTGQVNWDCPCLANALLPPCGSYFKEAFGCFSASKSNPKGAECFEKFASFRECLALHPDIYSSESEEKKLQPSIESNKTNQA